MQLTTKIKITPTKEQEQSLIKTMRLFNQICNEISEIAFNQKEFRQFPLHKLCYHELKQKYPEFSSQLIVRAVNAVADSYQKDKKTLRQFKKYSSVIYDDRVLSIKNNIVSLWTIDGRIKLAVKFWKHVDIKGQKDLKYIDGKWFLNCCYQSKQQEPRIPKDCIGIDLGITKIAVDSDGIVYHNDRIEQKRIQYSNHRKRLQICNTRSSKRRIKKSGNKESRFRKDVNHCISKTIVEKAKGTESALALEELRGITERTTVRKSQRNQHHSWSFYQLQEFIRYKAELVGIVTVKVNPRNTSRTCNNCGYCDKKNRKSQSEFRCILCGHSSNADVNAAKNIRNLGVQSITLLFGLLDSSNSCSKPTNLFVGS
jgi:putative transposase